MIGGKSGPRQEEKLRCKLQGHDDAHSGSIVVCELRKDEPILSNPLHPCPNVGDQGAGGPHAKIEDAQSAERARC
jgi:hypothetical protein